MTSNESLLHDIVKLAGFKRGTILMSPKTDSNTTIVRTLHETELTAEGMMYISVANDILAIELAHHVASKMNSQLGKLIGYHIQGKTCFSNRTRILFVTEKMLRTKLIQNPTLAGVSIILFDEFQRRSKNSDLNFALVERAQQQGSKVAFLLVSTASESTQFAYQLKCNIVNNSGAQTLPAREQFIEPRYGDRDKILTAVEQAVRLVGDYPTENGIIFMPGKKQVDSTIERLKAANLSRYGITLLPFYEELPCDDLHQPFDERPGITIFVSTDILESKAMLPNIRWVIDSGQAYEYRYNPLTDISVSGIHNVAQDRLHQRRSHCNTVSDSVCVRLFSKEDSRNRPKQTMPEIFQVPVRETLLHLKALNLCQNNSISIINNQLETFDQEPAIQQLISFGFIDKDLNITDFGRQAAQIGGDPREAAMLLKAAELGCLREMTLAIASRNNNRVFCYPKGEDAKANEAHRIFRTSKICDAWAVVRVIALAEKNGEIEDGLELGEWCRRHYISYLSVKEIWRISRHLLHIMRSFGYRINPPHSGTDVSLAQSIMFGLSDRIFTWKGRGDWFSHERTGIEACLTEKSSLHQRKPESLAVWEVFSAKHMDLITSAVVVTDLTLRN